MVGTVLVTGGTGFVAGWCIVQLLERGYAVRTTVRDAAKEQRVRAAVAGAKASVDRLSFAIADLSSDAGWDAAVAGCDYVLHVASPLGGGVAGDRNSLVGPARDGTLRVLRAAVNAGVKRVVMTSAAADRTSAAEHGPCERRDDLGRPRRSAVRRLSRFQDSRGARRVGFHGSRGQDHAVHDDPARRSVRPDPLGRQPGLGADHRRHAQGQAAGDASPGILGRGRARPRRPAHPRDDRVGRGRAAVHRCRRLHVDGRHLQVVARAARRSRRENPTRRLPNFVVRLLLPFAPNLRSLAPMLGRRFAVVSDKARQVLAFAPRPATTTVADCARSLVSRADAI